MYEIVWKYYCRVHRLYVSSYFVMEFKPSYSWVCDQIDIHAIAALLKPDSAKTAVPVNLIGSG